MESEDGPEQDILSAGVETGMPLAEGEVFSAPEQNITSEFFTQTRVSEAYAPVEMPASAIDEAAALVNVRAAISEEIERQQENDPLLQEEIVEAIEEARQGEAGDVPPEQTQERWSLMNRLLTEFEGRISEVSSDIAKASGRHYDHSSHLSNGMPHGILRTDREEDVAHVDPEAAQTLREVQTVTFLAAEMLRIQRSGERPPADMILFYANKFGASYGLRFQAEPTQETFIKEDSASETTRRDIIDLEAARRTLARKTPDNSH